MRIFLKVKIEMHNLLTNHLEGEFLYSSSSYFHCWRWMVTVAGCILDT